MERSARSALRMDMSTSKVAGFERNGWSGKVLLARQSLADTAIDIPMTLSLFGLMALLQIPILFGLTVISSR